MSANVRQTYNDRQAICSFDAVLPDAGRVHIVYMKRRTDPRFKKRQLLPTFIKQWREHRGLTQVQLAERVADYLRERGLANGYTYATLGRLENGEIAYTQPVLEALAFALSTDRASLLMRDPSDSEALWSIWDHAKTGDKAKIVEIAKTITGRTGTDN